METLVLTTVLPALVPAIADGIRGLIGKFTGGAGAQPQNVDEQVRLMQAETEKLRAIAELDRPSGTISQWVADLRASFRYIAAGFVIFVAAVVLVVPGVEKAHVDLVWGSAQSVWSFMFGDKMYGYIKKK